MNFSSSGSMGIVWASHKDLVIANVFFIISVLFHRTAGHFSISYTNSILVLNPIYNSDLRQGIFFLFHNHTEDQMHVGYFCMSHIVYLQMTAQLCSCMSAKWGTSIQFKVCSYNGKTSLCLFFKWVFNYHIFKTWIEFKFL